MAKTISERQTKFVIEYKDESGKVTDRWHYDRNIHPYGPILVENCNVPRKEKKAKKVAGLAT
jgi:hypothetical protein